MNKRIKLQSQKTKLITAWYSSDLWLSTVWTLGSCGHSGVGTSSLISFDSEFNQWFISSHPDLMVPDRVWGMMPSHSCSWGCSGHMSAGLKVRGQVVSESQHHPSAQRWVFSRIYFEAPAAFWSIFTQALLVLSRTLTYFRLSAAECLYINRGVGPSTMR